jgi:hypothetical protein
MKPILSYTALIVIAMVVLTYAAIGLSQGIGAMVAEVGRALTGA